MKKLVLFIGLVLMLFSFNAEAQFEYTFTADTLTNVDADTMAYPTRFSGNQTIAASIYVLEVSGAATLTAVFEGAVESGKWFVIETAADIINAGSPNSFTHIFDYTDTPFKYYRIRTSQTGTAVTAMTSVWLMKPKE